MIRPPIRPPHGVSCGGRQCTISIRLRSTHLTGHYQAIQDIAIGMLALASGDSLKQLEPLRAPVFSRPTPLATGDAAVINMNGEILLIQRADNHLWAMPGGALEVGETPAEGVVREAFEETGVACQAVALVGVFDSRRSGTVSRHHLYHFLFLCWPLETPQIEAASYANEVLDQGWYAEDALPGTLDPGHAFRIPHAFRFWHSERLAYFDI